MKLIQNNPSPAEVKIPFYLGELEAESRSDSTFKDCTEGLLFNVDVAFLAFKKDNQKRHKFFSSHIGNETP